jgi:hypothetical protein
VREGETLRKVGEGVIKMEKGGKEMRIKAINNFR